MTQITRTTPLRWMTLHLSQIFFTDALTFIDKPSAVSPQPSANPGRLTRQRSFIPIHDAAAVQVVGRKLDCDLVAGQYPDKVLAHLSRDVRQHLVLVFQFNLEHGIGQRFYDRRHHFNRVLFAHRLLKIASSYSLLAKSLGFRFKLAARSQELEAALLRQNHRAVFGDRDTVFEVGAVTAIGSDRGPLVLEHPGPRTTGIYHGF